jgi:predicted nucleic-acid-binding protein
MNVVVDTNVLIRAAVRDNRDQARIADAVLKNASVIAVTTPCLCEFAWVLRSVYDFERSDVALAMRALASAANVVMDRPTLEAGLAVLEAGGDFADGAIAHEGEWLGGTEFVSFDRKAVALLTAQGRAARLL